ncbi:MAG: peptidoglycan bridge formation glycyltransferase FemA/FemB family protein [Chloroflexi bacterium]|nr:peptidoglycan bridge formation glycyltransferase FemA/FemB family protein [Chloroflexota bacterium]
MKATLQEWNHFLEKHSHAHILQSGAWGELKSGFGWKAVRVLSEGCGAQILFRSLPGGFSIGYIPKGPVGLCDSLLSEIEKICKEERAIFLKIEPDQWESEGAATLFEPLQWKKTRSIQPQRTVIVSLQGSEEELLGRMKQKTRYNIRLAEKKEIGVRSSQDVEAFFRMAEVTGRRDGFGVHALSYYQKAFNLFKPQGSAELLIATFRDQPVAGVIIFAQGDMAWYMYGASNDVERNRMPTYLIQWEAMKWAKKRGCQFYDLWGIPDLDEENLEGEFLQKHSHEGLWGVYRFKRGFGGEVMRSIGAWDRIYYPGIYQLYQQTMRLRGKHED